MISKMTF